MNVPNFITIFRIILTPIFVYLFLQDDKTFRITAIIIFYFAALTDWYDGYYARKHNIVTRFGQFMDPLADKVLVLSATYILALQNMLFWWILISIFTRDILVTALRLYALNKNQPVITSRLAQWKTALHMILLVIIYAELMFKDFNIEFILDLNSSYSTFLGLSWVLTALLSIYTFFDYLFYNADHLLQIWRWVLRKLKII